MEVIAQEELIVNSTLSVTAVPATAKAPTTGIAARVNDVLTITNFFMLFLLYLSRIILYLRQYMTFYTFILHKCNNIVKQLLSFCMIIFVILPL